MATPVRPKVRAEFVLGPDGLPRAAHVGDNDHFEIRLFIEGAPEDTHAVTYQLHETYYDPLREVREVHDGFPELITSYGDFDVRAEIRGKKRTEVAVAGLTDALRLTYGDNPPDTIRKAIEELRSK